MKKFLPSLCFMAIAAYVSADAFTDWSDFENELRRGQLTSAEAEHKAKKLVPKMSEESETLDIKEDLKWIFPVKGYTLQSLDNAKKVISAIGSKVREPKFLEGVEFLVQPYLKLSIASKEKDLSEADIVAANNGIVVYIKKGALNSPGGNTVWLYNPSQNFFIYYGMLRTIDVNLGDVLSIGDKIGSIKPVKKGYELNFAVLMYGDETFTLFNYFDEMAE